MSRRVGRSLVLAIASLLLGAPMAAAVTVTRTRGVNAEHNSGDMASPFFTASADNGVTFGTTDSGFFAVGPAQAGQISSTMTRGTVTVVGNSTSAGADLAAGNEDDWLDGNGIPAGLTLTFDVALDVSLTATTPAGSLMTNPGLTGTELGDGIGITQTAGALGVIDVGEGLSFTAPTVSNVNFAGALAETGFTFDGGTIEDFGVRLFRSRDFQEVSDGAVLTDAEGTIGFGQEEGSLASNLAINNNFDVDNAFPRRLGAFTLEATAGTFALKGVGFQYDVVYDISPAAATDNADFNGDGFVDGADFLIWQRNLGTASGATQGQGNANPGVDGAVDAADLAIWKGQFGSPQPLPAAAAIPEPGTLLLALCSGLLAAAVGRRRR